jgi:hypothetical protein
MSPDPLPGPTAHRLKRRPNAVVSTLIGLLGIAGLIGSVVGVPQFLFLPVAGFSILLVFVAAAIDRPTWLCSDCGNRIEKTSRICPSCHTGLAPAKSTTLIDVLILISVLMLIAIGIALVSSRL